MSEKYSCIAKATDYDGFAFYKKLAFYLSISRYFYALNFTYEEDLDTARVCSDDFDRFCPTRAAPKGYHLEENIPGKRTDHQ